MNSFNKYFILFLGFNFFALQGMENKRQRRETNNQATIQVRTLKIQCALTISNLIERYTIDPQSLTRLPEELLCYIRSLNCINRHMVKFLSDEIGTITQNVCIMTPDINIHDLHKETNQLLYKFIQSQSENIDLFILVVDTLFNSLNKPKEYAELEMEELRRKLIVTKDPNIDESLTSFNLLNEQKLMPKIQGILTQLKLLLDLLIQPHNVDQIREKKDETLYKQINILTDRAVLHGWIPVMQLLFTINFFSRSILLDIFNDIVGPHSSLQFVEFFYNHLNISKEELHDCLIKPDNHLLSSALSGGTVEIFKYLLKLIEEAGLDCKQFINLKYTRPTPSPFSTLLIRAVHKANGAEWVQLLIDNGADVNASDENNRNALTFAQFREHEFRRCCILGWDPKEELINAEQAVNILKKAIN